MNFSTVNNFMAISICILLSLTNPAHSLCKKQPFMFNFGDSNSDTGGLVGGLGIPIKFPNGRAFLGRSTDRLCDGRLIIDFLCQSINTSLLNAYLDSLGSTFSNGANFAVSGSATEPKYVAFSLNIQVLQFLHFKTRSAELVAAGFGHSIGDASFSDALYMIDIGQNDLTGSFDKNLSYVQVVKKIPIILQEIKNAIEELYNQGGRKFWVHNTGPFGCLPQKLALVKHTSEDLDPFGCISSYNTIAKLFNGGLGHLCQELRSELKDATIVYVDIYAIKYDLIANSSKFFKSIDGMLWFRGAPYNYNTSATCGQPGCQVCDQKSQIISWDGVHYTEAANAIVSSKILSTNYSNPPVPFDFFCN